MRMAVVRMWLAAITAGVCILGSGSVPSAQFLEPEVDVLYTLMTDQPGGGGNFGFVAESIGDLDGDGASELIVGSPSNTEGGAFAGKAFIYSGRDGTLVSSFVGSPSDRLGWGVAGPGDVDGDGVPDYAISGPSSPFLAGPQPGRLVVISGATHTLILDVTGPGDRTFFGYDINAAGDVNMDGHADMIVGAPLDSTTFASAGKVHLISGADGTTLWTREGESTQANLGAGVSQVGDQNGDGTIDQAVGVPNAGKFFSGEIHVLSGLDGSLIRTLKAKIQTGVFVGNFFVHNAGDLDQDGIDDIYAGDLFDNLGGPGAGRGYIFFGDSEDRMIFNSEAQGDQFGIGRGAGDADGDGHDDVVIAAWLNDAGALQGGKTYVYSGRNGKLIRTMTGSIPGDRTGFDALAIGDVNDDGLVDFVITGVNNASGIGKVHVVAGVEAP